MKAKAGQMYCEVCDTSVRSILWESHLKSDFHMAKIATSMPEPETSQLALGKDADRDSSSSEEDDFSRQELVEIHRDAGDSLHITPLDASALTGEAEQTPELDEFHAEIEQLVVESSEPAGLADRRVELAHLITEGLGCKRARLESMQSSADSEDDWRKGRIS
jgi:hypothetical protein